MTTTVRTRLSETALDINDCIAFVSEPSCGGLAIFIGTVRDQNGGRAVSTLTYQAHPSASLKLAEIAQRAEAGSGIARVTIEHRVGELAVGDVAVIVAASGPHRGDVLDTCHRLIDEVKAEVPIWKLERYVDGSTDWVNCP